MSAVLATLTCCLLLSPPAAQDTRPPKPVIVGARAGIDGTYCEHTMAELGNVAHAAGAGELIFIIARLGDGESSRSLIRRRLGGLRGYLENTGRIPKERVITAEGERAAGLGLVEIYVGGDLLMVYRLKRGKDFWRGCSM